MHCQGGDCFSSCVIIVVVAMVGVLCFVVGFCFLLFQVFGQVVMICLSSSYRVRTRIKTVLHLKMTVLMRKEMNSQWTLPQTDERKEGIGMGKGDGVMSEG